MTTKLQLRGGASEVLTHRKLYRIIHNLRPSRSDKHRTLISVKNTDRKFQAPEVANVKYLFLEIFGLPPKS